MCAACGLDVIKLHRVGFAGITLANCGRPGAWAFLTDAELDVIMPGGASYIEIFLEIIFLIEYARARLSHSS